MLTNSKQETSANVVQPQKSQVASEIATILQEADKALLAGKPVVAHSAMRLAITELIK